MRIPGSVFVGQRMVNGRTVVPKAPSAFSAARKNRLDLSVGIALGSASQIALFVAPVLVLVSHLLGRRPRTCNSGRAPL